jgi:hypothetical protein
VQKPDDIGDMGIEPNLGTKQMRTLAKSGQRRSSDRMPPSLKMPRDIAPAPAS